MSKVILKKTESKVVVKCAGTDLNESITLNTDCLASTEALTVGGTPKVNILGVHWAGAPDSVITITRGTTNILKLNANNPGNFDFQDKDFADTVGNTSNITVTSTGEAFVYLLLRKVSGYSSKIELAEFSVYDDTTKVGE